MKYRCVPCDHEFESTGADKPRCPRCMGIHSIEKSRQKTDAPKNPKRSRLVPVILVAVLAGAVGLYFYLNPGNEDADTAPTSENALKDMLEQFGVAAKDVVLPFEVTEVIEKFAQEVADGKDDEEALQVMMDALTRLQKDGKWAPHSQREPDKEEPRTANDLLAELRKDTDKPVKVKSYELAVLLLAMARSQGINAFLAQIHSFQGEKTPADPAGKFGRYGVVFGRGSKEKAPPLFDPYAGRSGKSATADMDILPDEEAVAPYHAHKALTLLVSRNTSAAHKQGDIAIKLAPNCALFRSIRGLIFAAGGASTEFLAEFEKAVKMRDDAMTRTNLAEMLLLVDPSGKRAENEIQIALSKMPDYARAHAVLAMVHVMRGEFAEAEPELALAERLDPDSPAIALFWAQFHAAQAEGEEAVQKAELAVRLSEESLSSLIALAGIYKTTARFDEMRATLDKIIKNADSPDIAGDIRRLFGYEIDDLDDEDEVASTEKDEDAGTRNLKLKLKLDADAKSFGSGIKLDNSLGGGLGGGLGGSTGPGLGDGLKLDMNLGSRNYTPTQ